MATYNFTRVLLSSGEYDIHNPNRTDVNGQIRLQDEIQTSLPGKIFTIHCDGSNADIIFDQALSSGDEATLNSIVAAHKANS